MCPEHGRQPPARRAKRARQAEDDGARPQPPASHRGSSPDLPWFACAGEPRTQRVDTLKGSIHSWFAPPASLGRSALIRRTVCISSSRPACASTRALNSASRSANESRESRWRCARTVGTDQGEQRLHRPRVQRAEINGLLQKTQRNQRLVHVQHDRIARVGNGDAVPNAGRGQLLAGQQHSAAGIPGPPRPATAPLRRRCGARIPCPCPQFGRRCRQLGGPREASAGVGQDSRPPARHRATR